MTTDQSSWSATVRSWEKPLWSPGANRRPPRSPSARKSTPTPAPRC